MMTTLRWIAHAGLARARPGGTPTRQTLTGAERLRVDWIEIDVCQTADGTLVLRHDLLLPSLPHMIDEVGAAALTVDRWAVTPALCAAAHKLNTPLAAWTVNTPRAALRMSAAGADLITTDRVTEMRAALGWSQDGAATGRCDE